MIKIKNSKIIIIFAGLPTLNYKYVIFLKTHNQQTEKMNVLWPLRILNTILLSRTEV